jgi:hypothetical protein
MWVYYGNTSRRNHAYERSGLSLLSSSCGTFGNKTMSCPQKESVYNHIKQLRLPYTIIDVGWWYQIAFPKVPSRKVDYVAVGLAEEIVGKGNVPSALTDLRDIGRYVAKIIIDDRTLNRMVLAYNTVMTQNQIYDLIEEMSGEKLERKYVSNLKTAGRLLTLAN